MPKVDMKRLWEGDLHVRAAELLGFLARAKDDGQPAALNHSEAMDVLVVTVATLLDADASLVTRRDIREAAELFGSKALTLADDFRKGYAHDGKHHVERMGGFYDDERVKN